MFEGCLRSGNADNKRNSNRLRYSLAASLVSCPVILLAVPEENKWKKYDARSLFLPCLRSGPLHFLGVSLQPNGTFGGSKNLASVAPGPKGARVRLKKAHMQMRETQNGSNLHIRFTSIFPRGIVNATRFEYRHCLLACFFSISHSHNCLVNRACVLRFLLFFNSEFIPLAHHNRLLLSWNPVPNNN